MGNDDAAQGPRQVAGREDAQRLQLTQPFRHLLGKEQASQHVGEENVDDEVVELQRAAERGQAQGLVIFFRQGAGRRTGGYRLAGGVIKRSHGVR
ncbi:hypothetical protein D3C78_1194850 [compost metagenome]